MGKIIAVCTSEKKGTAKLPVKEARLIEHYGIEGDAHAGTFREVSLLSYEKFAEFSEKKIKVPYGAFGENLLVSGFDFKTMPLGTKFAVGDVLLELIQVGKECHSGCAIREQTGTCIMPVEGVFCRVLRGGLVREGDEMNEVKTHRAFTAAVITASDRCAAGEREDRSGPTLKKKLQEAGYAVLDMLLLPDDEEGLYGTLVSIADDIRPDVIFTTGGTGMSERDRMPEATIRAGEREVPGIAEAIRAYSMSITGSAMFSRARSVIRGKTLIINLPGSPKAVTECLDFLLPSLEHGLLILSGEGDN